MEGGAGSGFPLFKEQLLSVCERFQSGCARCRGGPALPECDAGLGLGVPTHLGRAIREMSSPADSAFTFLSACRMLCIARCGWLPGDRLRCHSGKVRCHYDGHSYRGLHSVLLLDTFVLVVCYNANQAICMHLGCPCCSERERKHFL